MATAPVLENPPLDSVVLVFIQYLGMLFEPDEAEQIPEKDCQSFYFPAAVCSSPLQSHSFKLKKLL